MSTYILIPGMGCGSWLWQSVARELAARGHTARSLTLPGLGYHDQARNPSLDDAVQFIIDEVQDTTPGTVTLVAHSGAGTAATGAAFQLAPDRITELIYYAAVVPEHGRSMADEFGAPHTVDPPHRLPLSLADVTATLMPDASPQAQSIVHGLMTETPGHYFYDRPTFPSAQSLTVPARYLLGDADSLFQATSTTFASRIGADIETVPGSHLGMLTHPAEITDAILRS